MNCSKFKETLVAQPAHSFIWYRRYFAKNRRCCQQLWKTNGFTFINKELNNLISNHLRCHSGKGRNTIKYLRMKCNTLFLHIMRLLFVPLISVWIYDIVLWLTLQSIVWDFLQTISSFVGIYYSKLGQPTI